MSAGDSETLAIPIDTDVAVNIGSTPLTIHLSGTLVATANVPEPSTLLIALAASTYWLLRQRSHKTGT
jgi:hypothetical protein